MKAPANRPKHSGALLLAMSCIFQPTVTALNTLPDSNGESAELVHTIAQVRAPSLPLPTTDLTRRAQVAEAYGRVPLGFEANVGQAEARVKFLSRGNGYNLFLTSSEATFAFVKTRNVGGRSSITEKTGPAPQPISSQSRISDRQDAALRIRLRGADARAKVHGTGQLPGKSNYFIGNDPKKWRINIPTYSRVKYESIYPGVDLLFYGNQRQLEYDFIVAPGASFKAVRLSFDGARRIQLDSSGDLLIDTSAGEIRQRKPIIYQETAGGRKLISGGYVIRGEREVAFEVGGYDPSRALVIDPVFVYSASIGGTSNDSASAVAVDAAGNAYITGLTTSADFPTVNPFQPTLKIGVAVGTPTDAFIAKLNPSGTALLYSTFLGGSGNDTANAIAVDAAGAAYVTGQTGSDDFPTSPGAFQTKSSTGGDAFVTKLNPTGSTLGYSTRLGGPGSGVSGSANSGRGIAVDAEGSAYVAGYTFSVVFPLRRPAQGAFNRGSAFGCCGCLYAPFPAAPPLEDGFVTKLNPAGSRLVYSTYIGGIGQDEASAIALDSSGSAYVTGRTCSPDFPDAAPRGASDAFLIRLDSSGREFVFARRLGGGGNDEGSGIALDPQGNAYISGQTTSNDLPTTTSALQRSLGGSVVYVSSDGGAEWQPASGLPNFPVQTLAIHPTNPAIIFAGLRGGGLFNSTDGGINWRKIGFPITFITTIAIDPKNPSNIYTDGYKSTNGGLSWTLMQIPATGLGCGLSHLLIDPVNPSILYLVFDGGICGDVAVLGGFFKTTDGGITWNIVRNGASQFFPTAVVLDPKNPSTLYAARGNLFKSTDGGDSWSITHQGTRSFFRLAIDPINTTTLYLIAPVGNLFKTTDGGVTFSQLPSFSSRVNEILVDPKNPSTVYAATGTDGGGGGVHKSTDGGQTWNLTDLVATTVNDLEIDDGNPARLYAGVGPDTDCFVAKSDPAGNAFVYASYLGSRAIDVAAGIGVDEVGNAYVAGTTLSDRFPRKDALQSAKPAGPFDKVTFTTEVDRTGSSILFSTYVGSETSSASGIAVDAAGKVYLTGTTGTFRPVPAANAVQSVNGGFDAFVIKIASPPRILTVGVSGNALIVTGSGFDSGAVILIDGVEQRTRNDQTRPATILIGKKAAKNIAAGQRVTIRVRNTDGLVSDLFNFTR